MRSALPRLFSIRKKQISSEIHREEENLSEEDKQDWRALGIEPQAFTAVQYFLPRSKQGDAYSYIPIPRKHIRFMPSHCERARNIWTCFLVMSRMQVERLRVL